MKPLTIRPLCADNSPEGRRILADSLRERGWSVPSSRPLVEDHRFCRLQILLRLHGQQELHWGKAVAAMGAYQGLDRLVQLVTYLMKNKPGRYPTPQLTNPYS